MKLYTINTKNNIRKYLYLQVKKRQRTGQNGRQIGRLNKLKAK